MRRPSPSLVISCLALFVALGGTGYAALKLPKNSVHSRQIAKGAVKASEVANGSLGAKDFKTPPKGPKGDKGDTGAAGAAGSALGFGHMSGDGTLTDAQGITFTGRGSTLKVYCFTRTGGAVRNVQASVDGDSGAIDPLPIQLNVTTSASRITGAGCPSGTNFYVAADKTDGTRLVDAAFYVAVTG